MKAPMPFPISQLDDQDMQAVPDALRRAAENARRLAEQTGTPFVVRQPDESSAATNTCVKSDISPEPVHPVKRP